MFSICVLIVAAAAVYMVEAYIHTYTPITVIAACPEIRTIRNQFRSQRCKRSLMQ